MKYLKKILFLVMCMCPIVVFALSVEKEFVQSEIKKEKYILMKHENEVHSLKEGANLIKCKNCGNSIDATKEICEFCNSKQKYYQEWILIEGE